ncbi:hypothetical protein ACNKHL_25845 [Shigella flexneri]
MVNIFSSRKLIITKENNIQKRVISESTRPVAVITGAARGIGKGCALELARGGLTC